MQSTTELRLSRAPFNSVAHSLREYSVWVFEAALANNMIDGTNFGKFQAMLIEHSHRWLEAYQVHIFTNNIYIYIYISYKAPHLARALNSIATGAARRELTCIATCMNNAVPAPIINTIFLEWCYHEMAELTRQVVSELWVTGKWHGMVTTTGCVRNIHVGGLRDCVGRRTFQKVVCNTLCCVGPAIGHVVEDDSGRICAGNHYF